MEDTVAGRHMELAQKHAEQESKLEPEHVMLQHHKTEERNVLFLDRIKKKEVVTHWLVPVSCYMPFYDLGQNQQVRFNISH